MNWIFLPESKQGMEGRKHRTGISFLLGIMSATHALLLNRDANRWRMSWPMNPYPFKSVKDTSCFL